MFEILITTIVYLAIPGTVQTIAAIVVASAVAAILISDHIRPWL